MKAAGLLMVFCLGAARAAAPAHADLQAQHREVQACALHIYLLPAGSPPGADADKRGDARPFETMVPLRRRVVRFMPDAPTGLGLLWHDARHVLTTSAVVPTDRRDSTVIAVEDAAGGRQRAEVMGDDPRSGAVLLRLPQPVPQGRPCRWGSAAGLQLGQALIGIGNLGVLRLSVQRGHVTGLQRALPGELTLLIESDVRSGMGMAGGPLLDLDGQVVGVHHAVYGNASAPQMAALALPADALTASAEALLAGRQPLPSRIGLQLNAAEAVDASSFLARDAAVRVIQVEPGSPAARAGLREGDHLLAIDGRPLRDVPAWAQAIAWLPAGRPVRLQLQRGADRLELQLTPEAAAAP
jgi:S1-C subfamily serine protease